MYLGNDDKKIAQAFLSAVWDRPYSMMVVNQHKVQHANSVMDFVYRYVAPETDPPKFKLHNDDTSTDNKFD
jgi:hypothetical protein